MTVFDEEDFAGVAHLLPDSIRALITLIGFEETQALIRHLGAQPTRCGWDALPAACRGWLIWKRLSAAQP